MGIFTPDPEPKAPEPWEHPNPGTVTLLSVQDGERVRRYRCDQAISEKDNVALYAGLRFLATVPKSATFTYE
jgi:hypothetical protein